MFNFFKLRGHLEAYGYNNVKVTDDEIILKNDITISKRTNIVRLLIHRDNVEVFIKRSDGLYNKIVIYVNGKVLVERKLIERG